MKKIMLATLLAGLMLITVWSSVTVGALSIGPVKIDTGNNVRPLGDDNGCMFITFKTLKHSKGVKVDTIKVIDENDPYKKIPIDEMEEFGEVFYIVYSLDKSSTFTVTATKEGYNDVKLTHISLYGDECATLNIWLQKISGFSAVSSVQLFS